MQTYGRRLITLAAYLFCGQFAFLAFIQNPGNPDDFEKARLPDLVNGTAHRPFVYRTLLPTTVGIVEAALPRSLKGAIESSISRSVSMKELFASTPAAEENAPVTYLIAYVLEFACLLGFAFALRAALTHFYSPNAWAADLLPCAALPALPIFYRYVSYDYDFPQLFLYTLCLLLLDRRRWAWFYPLLVLAALSKETCVLLVLVHLLAHWRRMPTRSLVVHALAQFAIVVGIRAVLQFALFKDNPGIPVEQWFSRNWEMISDPDRWGFLFFHFAWVGNTTLVMPTNYNVLFLLLVPVVCWRWPEKPILLRRGLWVLPVLAVLTLLFGNFDEMRDYYEAYPIVFLLACGTFCNRARRSAEIT